MVVATGSDPEAPGARLPGAARGQAPAGAQSGAEGGVVRSRLHTGADVRTAVPHPEHM